MNIHKNAKLTPLGRERLVKRMLSGQSPQAAARAEGVCPRTAHKWLGRYKAEGKAGLQDRSSRPTRLRKPTFAKTVNRIIALLDRQAYRPRDRRVGDDGEPGFETGWAFPIERP